MQPILFLGKLAASGLYILRICVEVPLAVTFGQFQHGEAVPLAAGDYLYVGSAQGTTGASTLPRRLLRHATRSGDYPPHSLRGDLLDAFQSVNMLPAGAQPPRRKRLRWHVDYLLDAPNAHLLGVIMLPATVCSEAALARELAADPALVAPAPGLGASDDPGATHLLHLALDGEAARAGWWGRLVTQLTAYTATEADDFP
jgi:Uri superfamily endonuclease